MSEPGVILRKLTGNNPSVLRSFVRKISTPFSKIIHGSFSTAELIEEIKRRIGEDYEILFIHSSMDALSPMYSGNAFELLEGLVELAGQERTLAMPAFFFGEPDGDIAAYYMDNPVFQVRRTPSQMGLLTELFRRRQGVLRSMHPSHSVCALGTLAEELTAGHHKAGTTFGKGTPFDLMTQRKTVILGIGTRYEEILTQVHHVEDLLGDDFPTEHDTLRLPVTLIDENKQPHEYVFIKQIFREPRHIERLGGLMGNEKYEVWKFHGVPMFRMLAADVSNTLIEAAKRGVTLYGE